MRHRVKVVPVKVSRREDELGCYVRRVVGYRAVCECGERSKVSRDRDKLEDWRVIHRYDAIVHGTSSEPR